MSACFHSGRGSPVRHAGLRRITAGDERSGQLQARDRVDGIFHNKTAVADESLESTAASAGLFAARYVWPRTYDRDRGFRSSRRMPCRATRIRSTERAELLESLHKCALLEGNQATECRADS